MTDDHDLNFAASAFAAALPTVEFRPDAHAAPRRHRRGALTLTAAVATAAAVAVTTTAVLSSGSNAPSAWSATPKHLSSSASEQIDQQCRAVTPSAALGAPGVPSAPGTRRTGAAPRTTAGRDGVRVEQGLVTAEPGSTGADTHGATIESGGIGLPQVTPIGDLPLILVDARGAMTLALYGDANHHVICTIDPDGRAMLTPDSGAWHTGDLIDGAAAFGNAMVAADGTSSSSMKLLGTTAPNVTAIAVDVPKVGTVEATVRNGHYALFVPQQLLGNLDTNQSTSVRAATWPAHVTTSDGAVHDTTVAGSEMVGAATP